MSTSKPESLHVPASADPPSRRARARRLTSAVAAVALVVGFTWASAVRRDQGGEEWDGPRGLPSADVGGEVDLKAVQNHPRLLIDKPGWEVTTVHNFGATPGAILFADDARTLEMNWYSANQYDGLYEDRLATSKPEATTVAGLEASIFTYGGGDYSVLLKPRDGAMVELRAGNMNSSTLGDALAHIARYAPKMFLAALPPEIITPGEVRGAVAEMLVDIPIPPGFDAASIDVLGINDADEFRARVTGEVVCSWIAEWFRADAAGNRAAVKEIAAALRTSHRWKALGDMEGYSDHPENIWAYADRVADGKVPDDYREDLHCAQ
jgi:hypothetical protein